MNVDCLRDQWVHPSKIGNRRSATLRAWQRSFTLKLRTNDASVLIRVRMQ